MTLAYDFQEWPMVDQWLTSTFYVLKKGAVVAKVVAWDGHAHAIRSALKQIGFG